MISLRDHGISPQNLGVVQDIFREHIPAGVQVVVCLFGSRANGTHSKYSDVDLLIECEALPVGALSKITQDLEESSLPYKFDLVDAGKLAPEYKRSVDASKQFLFSL
jgi:predicted nucleotidyltransferase